MKRTVLYGAVVALSLLNIIQFAVNSEQVKAVANQDATISTLLMRKDEPTACNVDVLGEIGTSEPTTEPTKAVVKATKATQSTTKVTESQTVYNVHVVNNHNNNKVQSDNKTNNHNKVKNVEYGVGFGG